VNITQWEESDFLALIACKVMLACHPANTDEIYPHSQAVKQMRESDEF
jgi:hypothetical protein